MGIDKKDIRSTYHFAYSNSLESLVQEAGRAGRDKKISEANILVSKEVYFKIDVYKFFAENITNNLLKNKFTRKAIRQAFEKKWEEFGDGLGEFVNITFASSQDLINAANLIDFSLKSRAGNQYNILSESEISILRNLLLTNTNGIYKYILNNNWDRDIHNYFHEISFKGIDTEKCQIKNLFLVKEFQLIDDEIIEIENQDTLAVTFNHSKQKTFQFIITATKKYPDASKQVCEILGVDPNSVIFGTRTNQKSVASAFKYSHDFNDFVILLEENDIKSLANINNKMREELFFVYSRDRETGNDTGRLIYRMHSMGFLEDYLIDYNKNNLYTCTFNKFPSIDDYTKKIEKYLRRYLSENTALSRIAELKARLTKDNLIDNIIECLYFLSEFSDKEIANKRKRATDEIESILNISITEPKYITDWYEQNLYIKEQIYFYFNAKYARIAFKINGQPFSLLDDYKDNSKSKEEILEKYLEVFRLEGTEQNNYKHMMGSCKKILRSLSETDLNNEWLLRLLKAFAMYSVNNFSYISEANAELELGFDNLYKDEDFYENDFEIIEPIFESYFAKLQSNIQEDNPSFKDIKLIRAKLLLKMQTLGIEKLIYRNQHLITELYA
jgi:hypothetical protein